jgi:hypothetical protein
MFDKVYVHYGSTEFHPELIKPLDYSNSKSAIGMTVKPPYFSGLWGSPIDSDNSWKVWNDANDFSECDENNSFRFKIHPDHKILTINSTESAISLVENYLTLAGSLRLRFLSGKVETNPEDDLRNEKERCIDYIMSGQPFEYFSINKLDFVKMSADGYSGMEISITDFPKLYWLLYGWDCDSIVVWSPDAIIQV